MIWHYINELNWYKPTQSLSHCISSALSSSSCLLCLFLVAIIVVTSIWSRSVKRSFSFPIILCVSSMFDMMVTSKHKWICDKPSHITHDDSDTPHLRTPGFPCEPPPQKHTVNFLSVCRAWIKQHMKQHMNIWSRSVFSSYILISTTSLLWKESKQKKPFSAAVANCLC